MTKIKFKVDQQILYQLYTNSQCKIGKMAFKMNNGKISSGNTILHLFAYLPSPGRVFTLLDKFVLSRRGGQDSNLSLKASKVEIIRIISAPF